MESTYMYHAIKRRGGACIVLTVLLSTAVRWCGTARSVRETNTLQDRQGGLGLLQALATVDVTVTIIVISWHHIVTLFPLWVCVSIFFSLLPHVLSFLHFMERKAWQP